MTGHTFEELDRLLADGGPAAAFEHLAQRFRDRKQYPMLFETRLMQKRLELGLPLIAGDPAGEPAGELRKQYEAAFIEAARETGTLYLADGEVTRAWPYFRAIGETLPVAEAIDRAEPGEDFEGVVEIAFHERVNPRKGVELVLRKLGLCRAISFFEQYPGREGRQESLALLVSTLYSDLAESLKRTIVHAEGSAPESASIRDLINGRDWLFGEYDYYVDSSHLVSILRFAIDLEDPELLQKAVEMAEYGRRLSPMFHFKGEPPFENPYEDYGIYLRALAGEQVDEAVSHFRSKLTEAADSAPAQTLVNLLVRLKRYGEAVEVALEHLQEVQPSQLACPSVVQLCQLSGDFRKLKTVAREQDDLLTYAAAAAQGA
jgi:hypothetical protein